MTAMVPRRDRVLVVDDETTLLTMLEMALDSEGLDVVTAETGEQAATLLADQRFDLLLTDKNLPGISGVDLIRQLRERGDDTPALIMTAHASIGSALETMDLGVHGFIEKPFPDVFVVTEKAKEAIAAGRNRAGRPLMKASQHFGKVSEVLASATAALARLRILIANPNPAERSWLAARVERDGDQIVTTATRDGMLRALAEAPADLLIIDRFDSAAELRQLLEATQRDSPNTVRVVTATQPSLTEIIDLIDLGVRAVVAKPLEEAAFSDKVDGLVEALRRR
jgi:DNA-binding NtrC family response regulator